MANESQVKNYLAYWIQLGKRILLRNGEDALLPTPVFQGDRYSPEFERCWQLILSPESGDCYLEGTTEKITDLLTPNWDLTSCSRCSMPVPLRKSGMPPIFCPCFDLPNWPNTDLPAPRAPVNNQVRLNQIRERLIQRQPNS